MVFLHPAQREIVERDYGGPARVSGSAGTGKTIVAIHRAVFLARSNPDARVLLTTYSDTLAASLSNRLELLIGNEPRVGERIEVHSIGAVGRRLYRAHAGEPRIASREVIDGFLREASEAAGSHRFRQNFLLTEWEQVVDAWQLRTWEDYRDVRRLGRKTGLPEEQRAILWAIFERVRERLAREELADRVRDVHAALGAAAVSRPAGRTTSSSSTRRRTWASRICASSRRWPRTVRTRSSSPATSASASSSSRSRGGRSASTSAVGRGRCGSTTERHIRSGRRRIGCSIRSRPTPTEWSRVARGRSRCSTACRPTIRVLDDEQAEVEAVAEWIRDLVGDGLVPGELGVFVRSEAEIERATRAVEAAGLPFAVLDETSAAGREARCR